MDAKLIIFVTVLFALVYHTAAQQAQRAAAVHRRVHRGPRVQLAWKTALTRYPKKMYKPSLKNIKDGYVVVIDSFRAIAVLGAIAKILEAKDHFRHLNPGAGYYYTNMYRWALRYLSNLKEWLMSKDNFAVTHFVWRKRFFYNDGFVPQWMRKILFFVPKEDWIKEDYDWKRYDKYGEAAFGKYYRYPGPKFNNWNSVRRKQTIENLDKTGASIF